tara:strand:- start:2269 stop:2586 length:318 start_codon:yes stop_codon:yes gene_type:complete
MSENKTTNVKHKTIDRDLVYKLACIQCTPEEIAEVVGIGVATLKKKFAPLIEKGKQAGRKSLRRAMWEKAHNGDTRVQIFLSKQYLGFKDAPEDTSNNTPLPWED